MFFWPGDRQTDRQTDKQTNLFNFVRPSFQSREHRSKVDIDLFEQLIKQDARLTTRYLVEQLECPHTTIERHLTALGKGWKYGVWIPHELSLYQLQHMHEFYIDSP